MANDLAHGPDQDIGLLVSGPFGVPSESVSSAEPYISASGCYRGVFWTAPETAPVLALEIGFGVAVRGIWQIAYWAPLEEEHAELLDAIMGEVEPEDLLPHRLGQLVARWENWIETGRVPVGAGGVVE